MPEKQPSIVGVAAFTISYLLVAVVGAFRTGSKEFLFYIAVMLILMGVVWMVHRRVNLTSLTLWSLSLWGLMHMMGGLLAVPRNWPIHGETHVLYNVWLVPGLLKYDQMVHVYGFAVTTWVCWQGVKSILQRVSAPEQAKLTPTLGLMVLVGAAGIGFGALNEMIEFFAVLLVPKTNVGGYMNTGWDLVANLVGASLASIVIYFFDRPER